MKLNKLDMAKSLEEVDALVQRMLTSKYAREGETTFQDVIGRVCSVTKEKSIEMNYETSRIDRMISMMEEGYFVPGGSILSGIQHGTSKRRVSLSNCYVITITEDSIEGIMTALYEMARTYSYRGGCGTDITILRPSGTPVANAANSSTGAVSFMPMFSQMTETIGQDKGRRGAAMISIDVRHPDLMSFIWCKADPERVLYKNRMNRSLLGEKLTRLINASEGPVTDHPLLAKLIDTVRDDGTIGSINGANISVRLSNTFMEAVKNDDPWVCVFPDIEANRDLYDDKWDGDYDQWAKLGGTLKEYTTFSAIIHRDNKDYFVGKTLINDVDNSETILTISDIDVLTAHGTYQGTFKLPSAREILKDIARASWLRADPGVMYWDHMCDNSISHHLHEDLRMYTTNPCGELALGRGVHGGGGNCMLAAHVLSKYVLNPYTPEAKFDMPAFMEACAHGIYLINVFMELNHEKHALESQRRIDRESKRVGIEFMGLGDMLSALNLTYGDHPDTISFVRDLMARKVAVEINTSVNLAKQLGPCMYMEDHAIRKNMLKQPFMENLFKTLDEMTDPPITAKALKTRILNHGTRNMGFNCVGPTGSIAIMAGNITSGIEPVFAMAYTRTTRLDKDETYTICHAPLVRHLMKQYPDQEEFNLADIKKSHHIVEAHELDYVARIAMQSAVQEFTDSSISSTINLPKDATVEDIYDIYLHGYEKGLKGVTVYRNGSMQGVLNPITVNEDEDTSDTPPPAGTTHSDNVTPANPLGLAYGELRPMPEKRRAMIHEVRWLGTKMYITVGVDDDDNPLEVFVTLPREVAIREDSGFDAVEYNNKLSDWQALTRSISMILRLGASVDLVVKQLSKSTVSMNDTISILIRVLNIYSSSTKRYESLKAASSHDLHSSEYSYECPECKVKSYIANGGCMICLECGYSKCS